MPGITSHIAYAYETFAHLTAETKDKMPEDALRSFIIGAIVPDLATGAKKEFTHFYKNHPKYGDSYKIPDLDIVENLFLKKEPTSLGVLSHLKYDVDYINNFLLVYAKPCGNNLYLNTTTGETMDGLTLWGNSENYGQLYQLYNQFNRPMTVIYMPKLNKAFGKNFTADKEGFLDFVKWLFPNQMPLSGIVEMDNYRVNDDINGILKNFFSKDGLECKFTADIYDFIKIEKESSLELAKQIDEIYSV